MRWIKEATAGTYPIGPFVNGSGISQTSLNIIRADIFLSKAGGALATINALPTAYHDRDGYYKLGLNTTDTNTRGPLRVEVNKSGYLPVWSDFTIVPTQKWDFFFGAGGVPSVGNVGYAGTISRVLSVGSVAAGGVGTVPHASSVGTSLHALSVGTALHAQTVGTARYAWTVGSLAFVSGGVIGSVGNAEFANYVKGGIIGTTTFAAGGVIGSVGHVAAVASGAVGTVSYVGYVANGVIGSVGWTNNGVIGTTTFTRGGIIGSVGHIAGVASGAIGTPYVAGGVIGSVGFLSDGVIGTTTFVRGGVIGSVGNVEAVTMGTVPHVMSVGSFGAAALAAIPTADAIADAILKRDIDQVEVTAAVHSLTTAILKAVSRIKDNAGTLETYMTNGTTVKLSQTVTTDTSNEPIDELGVGT